MTYWQHLKRKHTTRDPKAVLIYWPAVSFFFGAHYGQHSTELQIWGGSLGVAACLFSTYAFGAFVEWLQDAKDPVDHDAPGFD